MLQAKQVVLAYFLFRPCCLEHQKLVARNVNYHRRSYCLALTAQLAMKFHHDYQARLIRYEKVAQLNQHRYLYKPLTLSVL